MKLKKLFKEIDLCEIKGPKDIEISGISSNSKIIFPGNLFIAKRGKTFDGTRFIPEAIASGAIAILTDIYDPHFKHITQIICDDVVKVESQVAASYYGYPSNKLLTVGVTGTNGKTTTAFLVKHLFEKCGVIGSIEYIIGDNHYHPTHTTPDVLTNHKLLKEMLLNGCKSAVMEVSSHALDQGRVKKIDFDIGIFTNLTQDHLDYHLTMENYASAKSLLFKSLKSFSFAIINNDSPWKDKMLDGCTSKVFTYGIEKPSDLTALNIVYFPDKTCFDLQYLDNKVKVTSPLVGRHNVYNTLAAVSAFLVKGGLLSDIPHQVKTFPKVSGRLELVPNSKGIHIYVDFAHSEDALKNVLLTLQEFKSGKIITVFGCGGDRDKDKRAKMGQVSEKYSDYSIITSDNPRSEDPLSICQEIAKGFCSQENYQIVVDRKMAIQCAIDLAKPGDMVMIAGKGHEKTQIFSHKIVPFDDVEIAFKIVEEK